MNRNLKKYGYLWATLILFLGSLIGHWAFAWQAYVSEQQEHNRPVETQGYLEQTLRDTFENWQSEFLQLMWQVGGLALLLYVGSPQSKEGDERLEAKLDQVLKKLDPKNGAKLVAQINHDYYKKSRG